MSEMSHQEYPNFFHEIKGYIRDRQLRAMRSVNLELVGRTFRARLRTVASEECTGFFIRVRRCILLKIHR